MEVKNLAKREKQCQVCELDLKASQAMVKELSEKQHELMWFQQPVVIIGGIAVGIGLGVALGALIVKGK